MRVGVSLGISSRQQLRDFAAEVRELEEAGAGRIWLIDSQLAMKDVYVGLALAALHTEQAWLGTGVTNPITRHPSVTANAILAIDELSGGRAVFGIGAGDSAVYAIGSKPAKVAELERALHFFREALPRIPIYVAVSQPRMCGLAGRLADGAIVMGPSQADFVRRQVGWIQDGLQTAARDRASFDISLLVTLAESVDDVRAWAASEARLIADFSELPAGLEPYRDEIAAAKAAYDFKEHLSVHAGHRAAISDELARTLAVVGSAQECAGRLQELLACGGDSLIFALPGSGRVERLRFITEEVLSKVAGE